MADTNPIYPDTEGFAALASPPALAMSGYEEDRLQSALDALPDATYREAIEFSPSVTLFTRKLAQRCTRLISSATGAPIDATTLAVGAYDPLAAALIPSALPARPFNLIVFSDLLCELNDEELARVTSYALATLAPNGHCLLVHWLNGAGAKLDGDTAAERLINRAGDAMQPLLRRRMPHFRVDVLERV